MGVSMKGYVVSPPPRRWHPTSMYSFVITSLYFLPALHLVFRSTEVLILSNRGYVRFPKQEQGTVQWGVAVRTSDFTKRKCCVLNITRRVQTLAVKLEWCQERFRKIEDLLSILLRGATLLAYFSYLYKHLHTTVIFSSSHVIHFVGNKKQNVLILWYQLSRLFWSSIQINVS